MSHIRIFGLVRHGSLYPMTSLSCLTSHDLILAMLILISDIVNASPLSCDTRSWLIPCTIPMSCGWCGQVTRCITRVVRTPKLPSLVFLKSSLLSIHLSAPNPLSRRSSSVTRRPLAYVKASVCDHATSIDSCGTSTVATSICKTMLLHLGSSSFTNIK